MMRATKYFLQRIEWAGADVAINLEKAVSRQITGKLPPVEMEGQRLRARI